MPGDQIIKYEVYDGENRLTYQQVIDLLINDREFRVDFNQQLADSPFSAYRFETPAVSIDTRCLEFEFVLINTPSFATRKTDADSFREFFTDSQTNDGVVTFENLGRDAVLIVPSPRTRVDAYGQLAAFVRQAPEQQIDSFWRVAALTLQCKINDRPVWFSTAGGGVAWLHARIDKRPKYYGFDEYRTPRGL